VDVRKLAIALMAAALGPACAAHAAPHHPSIDSSETFDASAVTPIVSSSSAGDLAWCADETNRYRASIGLRPLIRSAALEDFATRAAAVDGGAHVAHNHFAVTNGAGVSSAETEILWWRGFSVRAVIQHGLAEMWQVGPGGHHYDILVGAFTEIGCGIAVNGSEVTVTQDFR